MQRVRRALALSVVVVWGVTSLARAHPGHPVVPGLSHEETHAVIALLSVVGALIVALGVRAAVRFWKKDAPERRGRRA